MRSIAIVVAISIGCRRDPPEPPPGPQPPPPASVPAASPARRATPRTHTASGKPAQDAAYYASTFSRRPRADELAALGAAMFRDPTLSASGALACASCHNPARAFSPPTARLAGPRAAPSLRYLATVPRFTEHFHDADGDDGLDQGPAGGFTWDGRAETAHDQARLPLFSPIEMANADDAALARRLARAPYAATLRAVFGDDVLATPAKAVKAATFALEVYQQDPATFSPYTSKFDAVIRGRATLSAAEARGKMVFDDPERGNCASCHPDAIASGMPTFSDFGYSALAVPRNRELAANADPAYFDLGLCGPYRKDLVDRAEYCGMFRTPTLRNVALRPRLFHNGAMTSLRDAVAFYATRDSNPARWYRGGAFDNLPAQFRANVEVKPPFGGRVQMTDADIDDVVAFLGALTDGYVP